MKWITRLCKIFRSEATADDTNADASPESNIDVEPTFPDIGVANRLFRELWKRCGGQLGVIVTTVGQLEEWTGMDRHKIRRDLHALEDKDNEDNEANRYVVVKKLTGHKREITVYHPTRIVKETPIFDAIGLESDRAKLENDLAKWKDGQDGRLSRSESGLPEVPEKQGSNAISSADGAPSRTRVKYHY